MRELITFATGKSPQASRAPSASGNTAEGTARGGLLRRGGLLGARGASSHHAINIETENAGDAGACFYPLYASVLYLLNALDVACIAW